MTTRGSGLARRIQAPVSEELSKRIAVATAATGTEKGELVIAALEAYLPRVERRIELSKATVIPASLQRFILAFEGLEKDLVDYDDTSREWLLVELEDFAVSVRTLGGRETTEKPGDPFE